MSPYKHYDKFACTTVITLHAMPPNIFFRPCLFCVIGHIICASADFPTHPLAHPLTRSLTHTPLTHALTHPFTHLLGSPFVASESGCTNLSSLWQASYCNSWSHSSSCSALQEFQSGCAWLHPWGSSIWLVLVVRSGTFLVYGTWA